MMDKPLALLGGLTAREFLRDYWHKQPLLIRGALRDVGAPADFEVLAELARRDDVESRLIENRAGGRWHVEHGPFQPARLARLPESDWTLLVQSVNHHLPHVSDILWRFNFLPYARLDDLMISYAPPGGTVGPHFDSYDVFLLQVGGKKRWQVGSPDNDQLEDGAPIKVLSSFDALQSWELEQGDMLYLPPKFSHYGVALEPGMTYSIGFRAPTTQELAEQFLTYLQDTLCLDGRYADPDLEPPRHPAEISESMVEQVQDMLKAIRWDRDGVGEFLGCYLTEPKNHVFFDPPEDPLDEDEFAKAILRDGLVLDLKSQMLFRNSICFVNGGIHAGMDSDLPVWRELANQRRLAGQAISDGMTETLYAGYLSGWWRPANPIVD